MAFSILIAENQTASPIVLEDLGVTVPASGSVDLTDSGKLFEIQSSVDLRTEITADTILLNNGTLTFTKEQSLNVASTATLTQDSSSLLEAISTYDSTGTQTFTGTITVNLNATHFASNASLYSLAADRITVLLAGRYGLAYACTLLSSAGNRTQARCWLENNNTEIAGTRGANYCRQTNHGATASADIVTDLAANSVIRVRATRSAGSGTLSPLANGSRLKITKLS